MEEIDINTIYSDIKIECDKEILKQIILIYENNWNSYEDYVNEINKENEEINKINKNISNTGKFFLKNYIMPREYFNYIKSLKIVNKKGNSYDNR